MAAHHWTTVFLEPSAIRCITATTMIFVLPSTWYVGASRYRSARNMTLLPIM